MRTRTRYACGVCDMGGVVYVKGGGGGGGGEGGESCQTKRQASHREVYRPKM